MSIEINNDISGTVRELDFLHIDDGYGGSQKKFPKYIMRLGGCSTVCACHAAACLAQHDPSRSALYPLESMRVTLKDFNAFGKQMYRYVYPGFKGMPETALFETAFSRYAAAQNVSVDFRSLPGEAQVTRAEDFIRSNIDAGLTIQYLLLLHKNPEFQEITWHWFTVTGYVDGPQGFYIIISTWSQRRILPFSALWDCGDTKKGGMVVVC